MDKLQRKEKKRSGAVKNEGSEESFDGKANS